MLAILQSLISLLASEPLSVNRVIMELGKAEDDLGASVLIAPADPLFREAIVVRNIDLATREPGNIPALVIRC